MLKFTLSFLIVLCMVLPGRISAHTTTSSEQSISIVLEVSNPEIDPALAERILRAAALKMDVDQTEVIKGYVAGDLVIDKCPAGYAVVESKGGLVIAIVDEF